MPRQILEDSALHPAIRDKVSNLHADIVHNVQAAAASHPVLVVGMAYNVPGIQARRALRTAGVPFQYLAFGSYLGGWRRRNALKMWTGWPTFPMVFVKGQFVGGASDVQKLIDSGELKRLLGA